MTPKELGWHNLKGCIGCVVIVVVVTVVVGGGMLWLMSLV
jgi:hypothetical protein